MAGLLLSAAWSVASLGDDVLDIDRLFSEPDLSGPAPAEIRIASDGSRVTYLRPSDSDRSRYDLWEYDLEAGETRMLIDTAAVLPAEETLSEEERARRERQRTAWRHGIVTYELSPDGTRILFPYSGDLFIYLLQSGELRRLTSSDTAETDARFSPDARYVSFIRDQNLHIVELDDGGERALTSDGGGPIKNGMAEFVAQEEMDRDTGYWWAPDASGIAFARVDESPVDLVRRYEIYAETTSVVEQRYPATGTPNARVALGVVNIADGAIRWLDLGQETDIYLARVDWFPDSERLAVQRQNRDQKTLDLLRIDRHSGESVILLTETGATWLDLYDDLTFLAAGERFIWSSARDGHKHLYLYTADGELLHRLTEGAWEVTGERYKRAVLHVDEATNRLYFQATRKSPLERHVYVTSLDGRRAAWPDRLSEEAGIHLARFSSDGSYYVDRFESPDVPPRVSLQGTDGELLGYIEENPLDEKHPYYPYLASHSRPEFGELEAADGQTLYFQLNRPSNFDPDRDYPAVVVVYGGPHGQQVKRDWWHSNAIVQLLARQGYGVFQLDNRGTGFRGAAFDAPVHRRLGHTEVGDQLVGLAFLKALPWVDSARIGLYGWSYGGYMTLMTLLQAPQAFAAGVAGAPVTDWRLYDTHYTERYLGTPAENPDGYTRSSVFPYVDSLDRPLLVIHGMADDNVLFANSTKLFSALQKADKAFEIMTYPGGKHGLLRQESDGRHAYGTIFRFFDRHLKPGEAGTR